MVVAGDFMAKGTRFPRERIGRVETATRHFRMRCPHLFAARMQTALHPGPMVLSVFAVLRCYTDRSRCSRYED